MEINAQDVMKLRQATGMPMMKCKKALQESDGDFERAIEVLRKEGLKTAEKKAGRSTSEGLIRARVSPDGRTGTMVFVLCESEPVKNTPLFREFVERVLARADASGATDAESLLAAAWNGEEGATVAEALQALVGRIGENLQLGGVARFTVDGAGQVGAYVHNDDKQGALVALARSDGSGDLAETAKELCQHIVFARPIALSRDEVPADKVEKELAFLREQVSEDPAMKGKPAQAIEGIVRGRLEKNFFGERVVTEQGWYKEPKKRVSALLAERGATLLRFAHFAPGA
jgi:elongation factor Ts